MSLSNGRTLAVATPACACVHALALCVALLGAGTAAAAPLKVAGRFLQDTHGNNIMMRGVNVPVYQSGYVDDLDAVAAAIALTQTNVVRLEWWAVPAGGTTEYTVANLDRAIQKFYDLGIIPVIELHDLTFQFGHDDKVGPNSDGNDKALFASTITAFWTRADVLAILVKHQDHLVINLANEWGSSLYSDATPTTTNFIQNYTDAITAMRNAGIIAPLMVDAPKGFEYQFLLDNGAALLAADPQHNTLLSVHAYWAASDPAFTDSGVNTILDAFVTSGLPVVLGEASSNAYTNIPCDPIHYVNLLTRANTNTIGYLFWAWYQDGQCGQDMNITVGSDGVTRPTIANPGFGYDALYHPAFGIDAAQPATQKADFSPVTAPTVTSPSSGSVTSTTATLGGTVSSNGGSAITQRGIVYSATGTNADPLIGGGGVTTSTVSGTTGSFATPVSGLSPATGYSFKAFATNAVGTSYTSVATFSTLAASGTTRTVCASGCGSATIQAAINASSPGDTVQVNSTYNSASAGEVWPIQTLAVPGAITIIGQTDVSGNPTSQIAYTGAAGGDVLIVVSPGSTVKNLKIVPGNANHVNRVIAAAVAGAVCPTNCHLNGLTIDNVVIDFTSTFSAGNGLDLIADNVTIKNSTIKGTASALGVDHGTGNAIFVDGDTYTIQNNVLNGFNGVGAIGTTPTGIIAIGFGADLKSATLGACTGFPTNYNITGNTIKGYQEAAIKWCLGRNTAITTNVITDIGPNTANPNTGSAIETAGSQNTTITGNAISWTLTSGKHGVGAANTAAQQCTGTKIIGNRVTGPGSRDLAQGIVVQNCLNTTVTGNVVESLGGSGNTDSVVVAPPAGVASFNTIQGNTVQNGNGNGIVYFGADSGATALDGSFVRDNVVLNHGKNGIIVLNMKGPGSVIAYNIVKGNNALLAGSGIYGFNMQGLSGTVFAANEGLDTKGPTAGGFFFANSQNIVGNCNFGAGNAGGLLLQVSVTPAFFNSNAFCRYGLFNHFDFDGDGKSDVTVYRNSTGQWISRPSLTPLSPLVVAWGDPASDDIPAPGNYNSSTRSDIAVYRYPTGQFIIRNAGAGGAATVTPLGDPTQGDIPVPGKYTQTTLTELAVFRSATAHWIIRPAGGGPDLDIAWGCPSCADIPVPFDFDGDGLVDIAVYRRSAGEWYIRRSSDGTLLFLQWGTPVLGDLPVPGNFSTPLKTDIAVYRSLTGEWIIRNSLTSGVTVLSWGSPSQGDVPVPADYNFAGMSDVGVYRLLTGEWIIGNGTSGVVSHFLSWGSPAFLDSPLMAR